MFQIKKTILNNSKKIFLVSSFSFLLFFLSSTSTFAQTVTLSSTTLEQADTLLMKVKDEPGKLTGYFDSKKINFFHSTTTKDWYAIIGIDVHKKPGSYKLEIKSQNRLDNKKVAKIIYNQNIKITKRDFKITNLTVDSNLESEGYTPKKIINNSINKSNPILNTFLNKFTNKNYFTDDFISPLSITTVVGNYGDIRKNGKYVIQHLGVDLKASTGTPVLAINNGKIVFEKKLPNYGNTLVVDHGFGIYSLYLHLEKFNFNVGQIVNKGGVIALSGNTGYSLGAHLHFSVKINKASVDPLRFLEVVKLQ